MPEGHKAERARARKQNIAAGIGDESGRIVRVKAAVNLSKCVHCQKELTITKSNTELKVHSENKHNMCIEACFPGAEAIAADLQKVAGKGKESKALPAKGKKKKESKEDLDALFAVGMSGGPGSKKKRGKK